MPPEIQLLRPLWLLALVPLGLVLRRLARAGEGGNAWRDLVDAHLLTHLLEGDGRGLRRLPLALLAAGWVLGVIALAGPVWERLPQPVYQAETHRVIVLDISPAMKATDLPPSRLARARFEVLDLLRLSGEGQTALLAYGAEPFVVSPLTADAETIAAQVPDLESDLLPVQGERREDLALEQAGQLLRQGAASGGDIIVVTTGLDQPDAAYEAARRLREEGFRVSVLGVGTEQGAPIPLDDGGFYKDDQGAILMPHLERAQLASLASAGGGRYVTASSAEDDTVALIPDEIGAPAAAATEQEVSADQWREEGPWLLLVLLPLAAVAFRRGWLSPLLLIVLIAPPPEALALEWQDLWLRPDQQAARELAAGEPGRAAERFERPDWRAAAQYQAEDYASALQSLEAMSGAEVDYNRGNALARLGKLEDAIAEYERALATDPAHQDARHNLDLLRRLLAQQEETQDQQPQQPADDREESQGESGADQNQGQGQAQDQDKTDAGAQESPDQGGGQANAAPQEQDAPGQGESATEQESGDDPNGQSSPGEQAETGNQEQESQTQGTAGQPDGQQEGQRDDASASKQDPGERAEAPGSQSQAGAELGPDDLLGSPPPAGSRAPAGTAEDTGAGEDQQAMEHMLRRVPDDPGGLLRQRFLLQHLRRNGRLP
jgi:Ca-activated chloride channel family protein